MGLPTRQVTDTGPASAITRLPYLFLAALLVGFSLDHLLPLPFQVAKIDNPIAHKFVPALLIFIGLGFVVSGVRKVSRTRTSTSANQTEHAAGTTNLQHWTRNPVCLGVLLFCLGIGVAVQSPWIVILVLVLVVGPFHGRVNGPPGVVGYVLLAIKFRESRVNDFRCLGWHLI